MRVTDTDTGTGRAALLDTTPLFVLFRFSTRALKRKRLSTCNE